MREILLVNFDLNIDGLYASIQSNEMINLKKGLEKNKIVTFQYFEKVLPNIIDVVDDLLSLTEDCIAFKITKENFMLTKKLIELIKEQNDDTEILGIGAADELILNRIENLGVDAYIISNFKENLISIIQDKTYLRDDVVTFSERYNISNVSFKSQQEDGAIDNTITGISETELFALSLFSDGQPINLDILNQNINTLKRKNNNLKLMLNYKDIILIEKETINSFIQNAYESGYQQIACQCNLKDLIWGECSAINKFNRIDLNTSIDEIKENIGIFENFLSELRNISELKICIDINDDKGQLKEVLDTITRNTTCKTTVYCTNKELNNEIILNTASNNIYNISLENGLSMYLEGTYQPHLLNNTVKHVYLKDKPSEELIENLDNFISTNHAIIVDKDNYDKKNMVEYSKHIHLIEDINETKNIYLDKGAFKKSYRKVKYEHLDSLKLHEGEEVLLRIEDDNDVDGLINDLNNFNETGVISENFVLATLEERCRWDYKGKCQIKNLPRMHVDKEQNITCCGCSDVNLGSLKSDYFSVINNIYNHVNKEEIKIGCNECLSKDKCSGCKLLPRAINVNKYCSFMKNSVNLDKFHMGANVIKALKQGSINFKEIPVNEFKIIHDNFTPHFNHVAKGAKSKVKQNLFLINISDRSILFDLFTFKIIEISPIITFLLEGYMRGYEVEEIIDFAKKDFSDVENIEEIIRNCKEELIKFQVIEG